MAKIHLKKFLLFLAIGKMQIKRLCDFILCQSEWERSQNNKQQRLGVRWGTRNIHFCFWNCKWVQILWKLVWRILKELKMSFLNMTQLYHFLALGSKDITSSSTDICSVMFISNLFSITRKRKQPKFLSLDENIINRHCGMLLLL